MGNFSGARNDALAEAKNNWVKRLEKKKRAAVSSLPNHGRRARDLCAIVSESGPNNIDRA